MARRHANEFLRTTFTNSGCTSGTKFSIDSIGKIVFLSREFAEKALEGREE